MVAHLADRISHLILKTQSLFWNQIVRINQITWTFKYDTALSWFCQAVKSNQKSLIHGISCVTVYSMGGTAIKIHLTMVFSEYFDALRH